MFSSLSPSWTCTWRASIITTVILFLGDSHSASYYNFFLGVTKDTGFLVPNMFCF